MPPAILPRDPLALQSWRNPENLLHNRSHSTAQETRMEDARESAILHGTKSTKPAQRPSNHDRSQGQQKPKSQTETSKSKTQATQKVTRRDGSKQKAGKPNPPPALKDVAYVRRTIHVPTQEDYPALPATIFKDPKQSLHNALHKSNIRMDRRVRPMRNSLFQCTLTCADLDIPAVEGEGTSKVRVQYSHA